jgi:hypothetical protein
MSQYYFRSNAINVAPNKKKKKTIKKCIYYDVDVAPIKFIVISVCKLLKLVVVLAFFHTLMSTIAIKDYMIQLA